MNRTDEIVIDGVIKLFHESGVLIEKEKFIEFIEVCETIEPNKEPDE